MDEEFPLIKCLTLCLLQPARCGPAFNGASAYWEQCARQQRTQRWTEQFLPSRTLTSLGAARRRAVIEGLAPIPGQKAAIRMDACNSWGGLVFHKVRRFMEMKPHHGGASLEVHLTLGAGSPFLPVGSAPLSHIPWGLPTAWTVPRVSGLTICSHFGEAWVTWVPYDQGHLG